MWDCVCVRLCVCCVCCVRKRAAVEISGHFLGVGAEVSVVVLKEEEVVLFITRNWEKAISFLWHLCGL